MPITIAGSGTITGISAGGLPDGSIVADDLASNAVTTAKVADANITAAKLDGAQSGAAPIYGARAWVNFDGTKDTTGTVSTANTNRLIRASGNVTSVLRNGTGDYTVNFTTAMSDANYSIVAMTTGSGSGTGNQPAGVKLRCATDQGAASDMTANSCRIVTGYGNTQTAFEFGTVCLSIFR